MKRLVFYAIAVASVLTALFLTRSRAGISSTGLSVIVYLSLFWFFKSLSGGAADPERVSDRNRTHPIVRVIGFGCLSLLVPIALFFLFGQTFMQRAQTLGVEDARFCVLPGMIEAAKDAWPIGSGAGTFDTYFQAYRNGDCGIYGAWDRAHNFFLEGIVTLGAPFAMACAVAMGTLVAILVRGVARRRQLRRIPIVGLSILLLVTLHDLVDFSLQIPGIAIFLAAIFASCCTVSTNPKGRRAVTLDASGIAHKVP